MSAYQLIIPLLLAQFAASGDAFAAEPEPATSPWSDTFTMPLRDQERTFVTWGNASWLVVDGKDLADPVFLHGKDLTIIGKLIRTDGNRALFYNLPAVEVTGPAELWRTRIDGDNLYLFGHFLADGAGRRFIVAGVAHAPSDQQRIAARMANVPATDWDGRLAVSDWVREQANQNGNREFWLASADAIVVRVIDDILVVAEKNRNVPLLLRAMSLCTDVLNDPERAARIGSVEWARRSKGAEEISLRMRKLEYAFIAGRWMPRAEAATAEFEARFNALTWNDAEGYYRLGLWCDANADLLPRARELGFRCFQAGFRADSHHNPIRRELGMDPVSDKSAQGVAQGDYRDTVSGVSVKGPDGWKRAEPIDGDATWIDPRSETSYITTKMVRGDQVAGDFTVLWNTQIATLQARTGFQNMAETELPMAMGKARHLCYGYKEGRFTRLGDLILVQNPTGRAAVRLEASYAESEQDAVRKQILAMASMIVIPAGSTLPQVAPSGTTPGARLPIPEVTPPQEPELSP